MYFTISYLAYREQDLLYLESRGSKDIKETQLFLDSVHYVSKLIPNLAQISHPIRLLLRKSPEFN